MNRRIAALTITVVALFGLTACTGSPADTNSASSAPSSDQPGDDGQSTADACALIQQSIEEATAEFESVSTADPAAVVDAMRAAGVQLADTATQITNDEVAAVVPSLQEMFAEVGEVMEAIGRGDVTKVNELSQLGTKFQETSERFQQVCTT